jgi:hypothetical protein
LVVLNVGCMLLPYLNQVNFPFMCIDEMQNLMLVLTHRPCSPL